ncbi:DDE-type integrase/transposase/recombinase [Burkholderia glumae]|nr:DDE-type integrase/transposase/recombinase [Burkholderia glumae]MCQ0029874.1 DDE-type integrase/transposase/recombinase [Burkholderia glumae]MCQ0035409.1 DDE-type integrase/transposase/recombinase [Burkholderia glumae]
MYACWVKAGRPRGGTRWHLDELFFKLRGRLYVLLRAMDEHGVELEVLLQKQRDNAAARRFFGKMLHSYPLPRKTVTDRLRSDPAASVEEPQLASVKQVFMKAWTRVNNRAMAPVNSRHVEKRTARCLR